MSDSLGQSTHSRLIAADKVQGTSVFGRAGEKLGTVRDIYLDKQSGRAEFATLAFGGVLGIGEKYHPVPWSVLEYDTGKDGFVIGLDRRLLDGAPAYEAERLNATDYG